MTVLDAAVAHLNLLRTDHRQDALYVRLAFGKGLEVEQIAEASGIPVSRVREILGGGTDAA